MLWLCQTALAADLVFAVLGDPQTDGQHSSINWQVFPALLEAAEEHGASTVLIAGDLVAGGGSPAQTAAQWGDFKTAIADYAGDVYMVPGNHDMYGGPGSFAAWRDSFPWLPTDDSPRGEEGVSYYIDIDRTRFVFITSDHEDSYGRVSSAGLAWLGDVLSSRDGFDHVFVVTHHPVTFSQDNALGGVDGDFWQLLVSYSVTGLFTGHWHRYQPSQPSGGPTWETIIGTGGGWQGFEPIRPYQQQYGLLLVEVTGLRADATFYVDGDGDGAYDDVADTYTLAWETAAPVGLRARYAFEDGAQDSAPEPLGKGIHGAFRGDARVTDGALLLDGDGDSVEAGAIGDYVLATTGPLTVSLHARVDAVGSDADYGSVLACYGTGDYYTEDEESNYAWYLSLRNDGVLVAFWEHGDGSNVYLPADTAAPQLLDGAWHHIALTRSEDAVRFWVDGEPLGAPVSYTQPPTGGGRGMLYLGADIPAYSGYDLSGALDEVCIYDHDLDAEEVALLAARTDCAALDGEEVPDTGSDTSAPDSGAPSDSSAPEQPSGEGGSGAPSSSCGCRGSAAALVWGGLLLGLRRRR